MKYRIERVKESSRDFKGIKGMKVLIFISVITGKKHIDGPMNIDDYDRYYEWMRKEANEVGLSVSDNLEEFKKEFMSDPGEFIPTVFKNEELEYIKIASEKEIIKYNEQLNRYFKDIKE